MLCIYSRTNTPLCWTLFFPTLWNNLLVLPWIQWLQVCRNVQNKTWNIILMCHLQVWMQVWNPAVMKSFHCWETEGNSQWIQGTGLRIMVNVSRWGSEITRRWGTFGISWIKYWLFPIFSMVQFTFIKDALETGEASNPVHPHEADRKQLLKRVSDVSLCLKIIPTSQTHLWDRVKVSSGPRPERHFWFFIFCPQISEQNMWKLIFLAFKRTKILVKI